MAGKSSPTAVASFGVSSSHECSYAERDRTCARMFPVSSSASMKWNVKPISLSPRRIAHDTGLGPRYRGSSDG